MDEIENNVKQSEPATPPRKKGALVAVGLLVIVAGLLISMFAVQAAYNKANGGPEPAVLELPSASGPALSAPSPAELSNSFRGVAKAVKAAVVHINTTEIVQPDVRFPRFPGFEFPEMGPQRQRGTGSGFIVQSDGYILTNHHVVGDADKIEVALSDGRRLKAKRVGSDPETDLAVIRVDATGLPTAQLGDSDQMEQGDWVLALGSPFGLQQTLTAGIVSATGREVPVASQYDRFIQTDASINPGNSGGPLVNLRGEVIGINTLIVSRSGSSDGIGFAIPSNMARKVYPELVKSGKVVRGYLGVYPQELDEAKARALRVQKDSGVLVRDITDADSPAAKAGIRSGDVITSFDGKRVATPLELTNAVADTPVGKSARVEFIRDGRAQSVTVTIGERPARGALEERPPDDSENASAIGIGVQTLTPSLTRQLELRTNTGVVVTQVRPGSAASEAGIQLRDVIHRIDQTEITDRDDFIRKASSLRSGDEVAFQIERRGTMFWLTVTLD